MKKVTKILLIVAAVCAVLGLGLFAAGTAMGGAQIGIETVREAASKIKPGQSRFFRKMVFLGDWGDRTDWDEHHPDGVALSTTSDDGQGVREYEIDAAVRQMELNLEYDQLELVPWDAEGIHVKVENDRNRQVEVALDGDCLEIAANEKEKNRKITVSYPEEQEFDSVEIYMGAGEVIINGALSARELEAEVGAGIFESRGKITVRSAGLEVGAGQMSISCMDAEEIEGECGLGEIQLCLTGTAEQYNFDLECGLGQISVGNDRYSSFASEHHSEHEGAGKRVSLECGMGEIEVSFQGQ